MSAFGQSVENSLADAYPKELRRWVSAIVARERAWLEERLRELKPGETWCHHDGAPMASVPADWPAETAAPVSWTRMVHGHVLPPGYVCDHRPVVQFGPAPDPWPPTECIPEEGYHVTPHNGGCFLR